MNPKNEGIGVTASRRRVWRLMREQHTAAMDSATAISRNGNRPCPDCGSALSTRDAS